MTWSAPDSSLDDRPDADALLQKVWKFVLRPGPLEQQAGSCDAHRVVEATVKRGPADLGAW